MTQKHAYYIQSGIGFANAQLGKKSNFLIPLPEPRRWPTGTPDGRPHSAHREQAGDRLAGHYRARVDSFGPRRLPQRGFRPVTTGMTPPEHATARP